jgi:hypothetical protein
MQFELLVVGAKLPGMSASRFANAGMVWGAMNSSSSSSGSSSGSVNSEEGHPIAGVVPNAQKATKVQRAPQLYRHIDTDVMWTYGCTILSEYQLPPLGNFGISHDGTKHNGEDVVSMAGYNPKNKKLSWARTNVKIYIRMRIVATG